MGALPTHPSNSSSTILQFAPGQADWLLLVSGSSTRLIFQLVLIESERLGPCRRTATHKDLNNQQTSTLEPSGHGRIFLAETVHMDPSSTDQQLDVSSYSTDETIPTPA